MHLTYERTEEVDFRTVVPQKGIKILGDKGLVMKIEVISTRNSSARDILVP